MPLAPIRKAISAGLGAFLAGLGAAMLDGDLTAAESTVALGLALGAGAATWRVPNEPTTGAPAAAPGRRRRQ